MKKPPLQGLLVAVALSACSASPPVKPAETAAPVAAAAPACGEGRGDCDGERANACEAEVDFSAQHCGACGRACGDGERCVFGACRHDGRMASSLEHTCQLLGTGEIRCWGSNLLGELGDGTYGDDVAHWGAVRAPPYRGGLVLGPRHGRSRDRRGAGPGGVALSREGRHRRRANPVRDGP